MTIRPDEPPYAEDPPAPTKSDSGGGGSEAGPRSDARYDDEPVLPQQTWDEDPRAWGEHADGGDSDDERILREVPPHH